MDVQSPSLDYARSLILERFGAAMLARSLEGTKEMANNLMRVIDAAAMPAAGARVAASSGLPSQPSALPQDSQGVSRGGGPNGVDLLA